MKFQLQTAFYSQVFCVSTSDLLNFTKALPFYRAGPVEAWNTSTLVSIDHELLQSAQRIRDVDEALVRRMFGPLDVDVTSSPLRCQNQYRFEKARIMLWPYLGNCIITCKNPTQYPGEGSKRKHLYDEPFEDISTH